MNNTIQGALLTCFVHWKIEFDFFISWSEEWIIGSDAWSKRSSECHEKKNAITKTQYQETGTKKRKKKTQHEQHHPRSTFGMFCALENSIWFFRFLRWGMDHRKWHLVKNEAMNVRRKKKRSVYSEISKLERKTPITKHQNHLANIIWKATNRIRLHHSAFNVFDDLGCKLQHKYWYGALFQATREGHRLPFAWSKLSCFSKFFHCRRARYIQARL